jgi:hypothetical protein
MKVETPLTLYSACLEWPLGCVMRVVYPRWFCTQCTSLSLLLLYFSAHASVSIEYLTGKPLPFCRSGGGGGGWLFVCICLCAEIKWDGKFRNLVTLSGALILLYAVMWRGIKPSEGCVLSRYVCFFYLYSVCSKLFFFSYKLYCLILKMGP